MNTILHLGHLGLLDSAPLLLAQRRGYFAAAGLDVELSCELGLAALTARLTERRLDAACVPASTAVSLAGGPGRSRLALEIAGLVSFQDLALVRSERGGGSGRSRPAVIRLGFVGPAPATRLVVQKWMEQERLRSDAVTLVPLSIHQLPAFFEDGLIDGFCATEPLPSLVAQAAEGAQLVRSGDLFPLHPGSTVVVQSDWSRQHPGAREALERVLAQAGRECADLGHRAEIWSLVTDLAPLAALRAEAVLTGAAGSGPAADPPSCDVRYTAAGSRLDAAGAAFIELACRTQMGAAWRGFDLRGEIGRLFRSTP